VLLHLHCPVHRDNVTVCAVCCILNMIFPLVSNCGVCSVGLNRDGCNAKVTTACEEETRYSYKCFLFGIQCKKIT
jgi:hypothetical protein